VREAFGVRSRVFGGRVYVSLRDPREKVATDENGRFEFHDVPAQDMTLDVHGESVVPEEFALEKAGDPESLRLRLHQRCSFEVVILSTDLDADSITLQDGEGKGLDILKIDSESTNAYTSAAVSGGRTGVFSASSAARTLQFQKEGATVRTISIRLAATSRSGRRSSR
jgi:hypothetical protein